MAYTEGGRMRNRILTVAAIATLAWWLRTQSILAYQHFAITIAFLIEMMLGFFAGWAARGARK